MKRFLVPVVLVPFVLMTIAVSTVAGRNDGCPAGWNEMTVDQAAAYIWPRLLAQDAFPDGQSELSDAIDATWNKNGDDEVCMKVKTFTNPNSRWYKVGMELIGSPTQYMNVVDNNANASNR